MSQTKRHSIHKIIVRVLGDYGFNPDSAEKIASRITSEIYSLVPARVTQTGSAKIKASPQIMTFHDITGYFPPAAARAEIESLMQGKTNDQMRAAYQAWCVKGNNPRSAIWLKWAGQNSAREVVVS